MVFFQSSLCNGNNVFTDTQMKLPDSAFNIDVKSAHTFQDPIIFWEVVALQRDAEINKTPCTFSSKRYQYYAMLF